MEMTISIEKPEAQVASNGALDNAEIALAYVPVLARQHRDPKENSDEAMAGYMAEVLRRSRAWAWFHADRAARRGLHDGELALLCLAKAMDSLERIVEMGGIRPSIIWAGRTAYGAALRIAEGGNAGAYPEAQRHQLMEIEESPVRTLLLSTLPAIADRHWQLSESQMSPCQAQLAAANDLIDAPFPPTEDQEIGTQ